LNSRFGAAVNEFRTTYNRIRDFRTFPDRFPFVQVRLPGGTNINLGTENSSHANELDQDLVEVPDDFTMVRGSHTYTFGTHNEFFTFRNLFIQNNFGNYQFASIDQFAAGVAQSYQHSFSLTPDPRQAAAFSVYQFGLYVGDQWRVRPNFTLTYGVRWDKPVFPDKPTANRASVTLYGFATDIVPSPSQWSPRVGFNWDLGAQTRQQLRGGIGYFSGRNPFVYLSNQYGNTGIEFRRLSLNFNANNSVAFSADPDAQPKSVGNAGTNEIDMIDPDYQFPAIVRGNLAYDRNLPLGIVGNVELLFSDTAKDVTYRNVNLVQTTTRLDGRPVFGRVTTSVQRRHPAPEDRRGQDLDGDHAARAAIPGRVVRARRVLLRPVQLGHRHPEQHGAIDLAERLYAGQHPQPAARGLRLRLAAPRRPERLV